MLIERILKKPFGWTVIIQLVIVTKPCIFWLLVVNFKRLLIYILLVHSNRYVLLVRTKIELVYILILFTIYKKIKFDYVHIYPFIKVKRIPFGSI